MKRTLIFLLTILSVSGYSQVASVTLKDCYRLARENYPRLTDVRLQQAISDLKQKNIGSAWNPQLNLNGQATYQSEVTKVNMSVPGVKFAEPPKDQFKVYLDVKQTIYDGGVTKAGTSLEKSSLAAEQQNLEIEVYALHEKVNQLYFSALLLAENEEVIRLKKGMLEERIKVLESMFRNGMVTSRDVELLKAERLLAEQQIGEIYGERAAVIGSLGILTNRQLDEKTRLEVPVISTTNDSVSRPELRYFDLIGSKIDQNSLFLQRNRYPKVFGFGQAGYGKPGLNMLKDNVNPFYMVGLGLSWNIIDWKQTSRSREILEVQKQMVGSQRALFDQNLSSALFRAGESIRKVEKLLKIDDELVAVRNNIVKNSTSQLDNGTITSADYIVDLNAATQAAVSKESHKVQLYQAIANYNTLAGKP